MQINSIATHYKFCPASATTIVSTGGILVHGIIVDAQAAAVTIKEGNGSTTIGTVRSGASPTITVEVRTPFVAKNGLSITTPASTSACVFYSSIGN